MEITRIMGEHIGSIFFRDFEGPQVHRKKIIYNSVVLGIRMGDYLPGSTHKHACIRFIGDDLIGIYLWREQEDEFTDVYRFFLVPRAAPVLD